MTDAPAFDWQFCEMISAPSISRWAGPIIDLLLDYVGHVTLCSRLMDHLDSYDGWSVIKDRTGESIVDEPLNGSSATKHDSEEEFMSPVWVSLI